MNDLVKIFKSLSDPTRIAIVQKLSEGKEFSCQEMSQLFNLSQPTLSHHFGKLIDAGIVSERKDRVFRYYSLNKKHLAQFGIHPAKMFEHR